MAGAGAIWRGNGVRLSGNHRNGCKWGRFLQLFRIFWYFDILTAQPANGFSHVSGSDWNCSLSNCR